MAVTLTSRFGLPQWGTVQDTPSRDGFNQAFKKIDDAAAKDLGQAPGTTLPTTNLSDGMYAATLDSTSTYRQFYRRAAGAWSQVGGNTWRETFHHRADPALQTGALAVQVSHPGLTNPGAREFWDGSSIRGGRQAIGDLNTGQPGALHVGDTDVAVDLVARGRAYVKTAGTNGRGFVAAAHAAEAGPLFTAREVGGTDPWQVDSRGRMRAQAPVSFGAADLTAGVPVVSAPGTSDVTAADLYAAASKSALRILRALGDTDPIARFEQDRIVLGRSSWAGARVDIIAPTVSVTGPLSVTGAAGFGSISSGPAAVTTLRATDALRALSVAADNGFNAEAGRVYSQTVGSGATVLSRPPVQVNGSAATSLRQAMTALRTITPNAVINVNEATVDVPFTMHEDGYLRLDALVTILADTGNSNSFETCKAFFTFDLRSSSGLIESSPDYVITATSDDTSRQVGGHVDNTCVDVFATRLSAGSYTLRIRHSRTTVLGARFTRAVLIFTPCVLASTS